MGLPSRAAMRVNYSATVPLSPTGVAPRMHQVEASAGNLT
jgi:hypothetical protein